MHRAAIFSSLLSLVLGSWLSVSEPTWAKLLGVDDHPRPELVGLPEDLHLVNDSRVDLRDEGEVVQMFLSVESNIPPQDTFIMIRHGRYVCFTPDWTELENTTIISPAIPLTDIPDLDADIVATEIDELKLQSYRRREPMPTLKGQIPSMCRCRNADPTNPTAQKAIDLDCTYDPQYAALEPTFIRDTTFSVPPAAPAGPA